MNAVYGFTSVLLNVIAKLKPDYIVATFDLKEPTFRHKEFKDYKATRVKAPDDLYEQIPRVKEILGALNIPIFEKEGYEADDIIATFAKQSETLHPEVENIIVTGDLDTLQLVNDKTKVYALRRGMSDTIIYDEKAIMERYGLSPEQMNDYKGLRGDPSDNLPGVKGVGEKTAIELLKKYKSIEEIYKNLPEIKEGVRKKLEKDKVQAYFSKRLAILIEDVPVKLNLEESGWEKFDRVKAINLFRELEFFSLLRRLPGYDDFAKSGNNLESEEKKTKVNNIVFCREVKPENYESVLKKIKPGISISIATDAGEEGGIKGIAFSTASQEAFYISKKIFQTKLSFLKDVLQDEKIKKIGFNLKYERKLWQSQGIDLRGLDFDLMLAAYVLNPGTKVEWENLALEYLGIMTAKAEKTSGQSSLIFEKDEKDLKAICEKAAHNISLVEILNDKIEEISKDQFQQGKKSTLRNVFWDIEIPLIRILSGMEQDGIKINKIVLRGISEKLNGRITTLEKNIQKLAGKKFNVNSSVQLREILFEKLKIPSGEVKKGKTGLSTASSELEKIRSHHPIIEKVEEYRELFKLKTTYLDTLPELTDDKSRLHTTFNQAITATGRLSSSDPNLQNIPIRTELGQVIRTAFEAEEGFRLVGADYSQVELRIAAHLSGDVKMITTFLNGEDIHTATAARVNKVPLDKVTGKMRSAAKALNFGIIYGMSTFGFAQSAGVAQEEAKQFIRKYFENYPQVAQFLDEVKILVREKGYVETELGRRRYIPEINSSNIQLRNQAERMAVNMPIQGLAADIIKLAMIEVDKFIVEKYPKAKMVLQIHDELLFEVPEKEADAFAKDVKELMENVYQLSVPLAANIKVGDNWGEI